MDRLEGLLSPKQVARALGVSESSLKRWCDKGLLPTIRTAGGHRKVPSDAVLSFLRESGKSLVRPEVLGLPSVTGTGPLTLDRSAHLLQDALLQNDEERARRVILDLYLAGHLAVDIFDSVVAETFRLVGDAWECGDIDVYQERRSCEICLRALSQLADFLPPPKDNAPLAVGATLSGDQYTLPTLMVEITLREAGWRAASYGSSLPLASLLAAITELRPRLFWLSVSYIASERQFLTDIAALRRHALDQHTALVLGGRALTPEIRRQLEFVPICENLRQLRSFVDTLQSREVAPVHAAAPADSDSRTASLAGTPLHPSAATDN